MIIIRNCHSGLQTLRRHFKVFLKNTNVCLLGQELNNWGFLAGPHALC